MRIGTIVTLEISCLGNRKGTRGIVFNDYPQIIFENGEYDGFSKSDLEQFVSEIGYNSNMSHYVFTNVMQLSRDFENGLFDFKTNEEL